MMKNNDKCKKEITNTKTHAIITIVTLAIASVVMTSGWQIPQATASSSEEIKASRGYLLLLIRFGMLFQI